MCNSLCVLLYYLAIVKLVSWTCSFWKIPFLKSVGRKTNLYVLVLLELMLWSVSYGIHTIHLMYDLFSRLSFWSVKELCHFLTCDLFIGLLEYLLICQDLQDLHGIFCGIHCKFTCFQLIRVLIFAERRRMPIMWGKRSFDRVWNLYLCISPKVLSSTVESTLLC